jgi:hypothetical protein
MWGIFIPGHRVHLVTWINQSSHSFSLMNCGECLNFAAVNKLPIGSEKIMWRVTPGEVDEWLKSVVC